MATDPSLAETESERYRWRSEELMEKALTMGNWERYMQAAQVAAINGLSAAIEEMEDV